MKGAETAVVAFMVGMSSAVLGFAGGATVQAAGTKADAVKLRAELAAMTSDHANALFVIEQQRAAIDRSSATLREMTAICDAAQ